MDANQKKAVLLGMSFGAAANQLRKMVLLSVLKKHEENICFRCGKPIMEHWQLSVEHKVPWLDSDVGLFWDLGNVAFSHLSCNSAAGKKMAKGPIPHGTHSGYAYRDCRCDACRKGHRDYARRRKAGFGPIPEESTA